MIERIKTNENRLKKCTKALNELEGIVVTLKDTKKDYKALSRYYGSKSWFHDKASYEEGKIPKIKAGVLSEDAVWDMITDFEYHLKELKRILKDYSK